MRRPTSFRLVRTHGRAARPRGRSFVCPSVEFIDRDEGLTAIARPRPQSDDAEMREDVDLEEPFAHPNR